MNYFQAIILSIIEGITEFLPISSTGHLILASKVLGIEQTEFVKSFEIIIQLGAILAVVVLYWKKIVSFDKNMIKVLSAFVPTALVGAVLYKFIKVYLLGNSTVTLVSLFVGGIALIVLERMFQNKKNSVRVDSLTHGKATIIGVFQAVSVVPGISRSAASIIGGMVVGLKRVDAVDFAFLLAIPTMAAATVLDIAKSYQAFSIDDVGLLTVGFAGSFITALVVVKWFIRYVQKNSFAVFGYYRIILAVVFWVLVR